MSRLKREVIWGNNVVTFVPSGGFTSSETFGHEFGHIIQVQTQGWSNMQARGIWEQLFIKGNAYLNQGTNEFGAESMLHNVGGQTIKAPIFSTDPFGNSH